MFYTPFALSAVVGASSGTQSGLTEALHAHCLVGGPVEREEGGAGGEGERERELF